MLVPGMYFLVGATACGKTAVAQWIAEREGCDILSADSMLVYRGMDIGTAKPDATERQRVRYWGVDVADVWSEFSVAMFLEVAQEAQTACAAAGRPLIVAGGTGLYVKCLTEGLNGADASDVESRERFEALWREEGVEGLRQALLRRAPEALEALADPFNPRRLIRALEKIEQGVKAGRSWGAVDEAPVLVGLLRDAADLRERIEARVAAMYEQGLESEIRDLLALERSPSRTAMQAIGYAEGIAAVRGEIPRGEAMERTKARTRHLAKRQMTWFRRQAHIRWLRVAPDETVPEVGFRVVEEWKRIGALPWRAYSCSREKEGTG